MHSFRVNLTSNNQTQGIVVEFEKHNNNTILDSVLFTVVRVYQYEDMQHHQGIPEHFFVGTTNNLLKTDPLPLNYSIAPFFGFTNLSIADSLLLLDFDLKLQDVEYLHNNGSTLLQYQFSTNSNQTS